tara:strand:- start:4853 stop:5275 length:423 start_codon:yes stop_codon:yes gene_type:complete
MGRNTNSWPAPGLYNVGSYQVSGQPYISGSTSLVAGAEEKVEFPYVTKTVTVVNHSSYTLRVHFNSTGSTKGGEQGVINGVHYVELDSDEDSYTFNAKCKEIYVSAPSGNGGAVNYRVIAELTGISTTSMYPLTGSGLTK